MDDTQSRIRDRLIQWRDLLLAREYPGCGFSMTAPMILSDDNIAVLADCATPIRTMTELTGRIRWAFASVYGEELIGELTRIYDDLGDLSALTKPPEPKKRSIVAELLADDDEDTITGDSHPPVAPSRGRGSGRGRGRGRGAGTSTATTPARRTTAQPGRGAGRGKSTQKKNTRQLRKKKATNS